MSCAKDSSRRMSNLLILHNVLSLECNMWSTLMYACACVYFISFFNRGLENGSFFNKISWHERVYVRRYTQYSDLRINVYWQHTCTRIAAAGSRFGNKNNIRDRASAVIRIWKYCYFSEPSWSNRHDAALLKARFLRSSPGHFFSPTGLPGRNAFRFDRAVVLRGGGIHYWGPWKCTTAVSKPFSVRVCVRTRVGILLSYWDKIDDDEDHYTRVCDAGVHV